MGLFSKKVCDICGGEIGLLGNRKLEDGNLCKNCARLLSPFMTDRRQSTVEEIRRHLAYRQANLGVLAAIHPTTVLGGNTKVYIDEANRKFFVTRSRNWRDENPDVIDFSQVVDVRTEVQEHRTEEYHNDREGRKVSYDPPRYHYSYEFDTTILVDSPYFNEIHFELTDQRPERLHSQEYRYFEQLAEALHSALMPASQPAAAAAAFAQAVAGLTEKAKPAVPAAPAAPVAEKLGEKGKGSAKPANDGQWVCAACGAMNAGNFCTNCGAKKPEPVKVFRCNKCGWTPEDPTNPPRFCPNCGDPFNEADRA